jgi:hypothetical protein
LHPQQIIGNLLNTLRDRPTVHGFERDRAQDQQVERALQDVGLVAHPPSAFAKATADKPCLSCRLAKGEDGCGRGKVHTSFMCEAIPGES